MTLPSPRLASCDSVVRSTVWARNRTEPSPKSALAPPVWAEDRGMFMPVLSQVPSVAQLALRPRWLIDQRMVLQLKQRLSPPLLQVGGRLVSLGPPIGQPCGPWLVMPPKPPTIG